MISVIVNIETRDREWCHDDPDIDSVIFTTISSSVYKQYSSILPSSQLVVNDPSYYETIQRIKIRTVDIIL